MKAATALISIATAAAIWPLIPKAVKIPTVEELEERVSDRTAELAQANDALREENLQRARAERSLIDARNEAESANRAKSSFLSVMSHELRTPLNVILGYAELIQMRAEAEGDSKLAGQVNTVWRSGEHLLNLIQDILDLSRIDSGRLAMSPEPLHLAEIVKEAIEEQQPLSAKQNITVAAAIGEEDIVVFADRVRMHQVLANLITNAIKYNDAGGSVSVTLQTTSDSTCEITVQDDGWGVPPERLHELFEPFSRLGRGDSGKDGTGIGLTLTRQIVELLDGDIRHEAPEAGGSKFVVSLPTIEAPPTAEITYEASNLNASRRALSVLYIEDNPSNIALLGEILNAVAPDAALDTAMTGMDGVEKAKQNRPDLILLDIGLPDIDGFAVLDKLRQHYGSRMPRVVFLTADATDTTRNHSRRLGVREFLTKPVAVREIANLVQNHPGDPFGGRLANTA